MKKIGIIANPKRPRAADVFERLSRKAAELDLELYADQQTAAYLPAAAVIEFDQFAGTVDVLFALGGDGTVLFGAKILNGAGVPVFGINLGSLGFLTGVGEDEIETALEAAAAGNFETDRRIVAHCSVYQNGTCSAGYRILNDAVLGFGGSSQVVNLELLINGRPVSVFTCDGMIVSTPTGSTGHALAAGGPIIQPCAGVFGISVICPHTLSNRPIILPDSSEIEIRIQHSHKKLLFAADGQDVAELDEGDAVKIVKSESPVTFLHLPDYDYFDVLSRKLHWRGSN
ncbi:MAG: NAD(+)/NADH kinase [Kiritimatiellales bacterium]